MRIATAITFCLVFNDVNAIPVQWKENNTNHILSTKLSKVISKPKFQQLPDVSSNKTFRKISNNYEKQLDKKQDLNDIFYQMAKNEEEKKCNCKEIKENGRQLIESDRMKTMASVAIDVLLTLVQPLFGLPGVILGNLVRPLLMYMTMRVFTGGQTFIKNMMSEENQGSLRDEPYAAYPVFIPGYGSYILLSDIDPSELVNITVPMNENSSSFENDSISNLNVEVKEEIKRAKRKDTDINNTLDKLLDQNISKENNDTVFESALQNVKDRRENNKKYRNICEEEKESVKRDNDNKKYQMENSGNASVEKEGSALLNNNVDIKFNPLFLGQTHLIPIVKKPNVFESEKDLEAANWSGETGDTIRESIKQIVGSGAKIKSLKKRIMLNILDKLRGAILEF